MKHKCKTMVGVQKDIKLFNERVKGCKGFEYLNSSLRDATDNDSLGGIIFDVLFYGKKKEEAITQGFGMRFLYCPFCGEKL